MQRIVYLLCSSNTWTTCKNRNTLCTQNNISHNNLQIIINSSFFPILHNRSESCLCVCIIVRWLTCSAFTLLTFIAVYHFQLLLASLQRTMLSYQLLRFTMHVKQNKNHQPDKKLTRSKNNNRTKLAEICLPKNIHSIASDENDKMQKRRTKQTKRREKNIVTPYV